MMKLNPAFGKLRTKRVVDKQRIVKKAAPGSAMYAALEARGLIKKEKPKKREGKVKANKQEVKPLKKGKVGKK